MLSRAIPHLGESKEKPKAAPKVPKGKKAEKPAKAAEKRQVRRALLFLSSLCLCLLFPIFN